MKRAIPGKQNGFLLLGMLLLSLVLCTGAAAGDTNNNKGNNENLGIRVNKPIHNNRITKVAPQQQLTLTVEPNKQHYTVGDTFSMNIQANQDFYLWVFSMNENAGRGRMLIPGLVQSRNKYRANLQYKVPVSGSYELFMDKPGLEKVIVVASTKWINVDVSTMQKNKYFYSSSYENLQGQLEGLRLRPSQGGNVRTGHTIVVTELSLPVSGAAAPISVAPGFQTSGDDTVVFVSQNKDTYRLGEIATVAYGSNKSGWLSLYVQYPNGRTDFLKKEHVDGKKIYTLQADVVRPAGNQKLMAVFSADKKADFPVTNVHFYTDYFSTRSNEALRLLPTPDKRPVYDISSFTIE
jgi:hypothetical protein